MHSEFIAQGETACVRNAFIDLLVLRNSKSSSAIIFWLQECLIKYVIPFIVLISSHVCINNHTLDYIRMEIK